MNNHHVPIIVLWFSRWKCWFSMIMWTFTRLPEGQSQYSHSMSNHHKPPSNHQFPMVFLWFSHETSGFFMVNAHPSASSPSPSPGHVMPLQSCAYFAASCGGLQVRGSQVLSAATMARFCQDWWVCKSVLSIDWFFGEDIGYVGMILGMLGWHWVCCSPWELT